RLIRVKPGRFAQFPHCRIYRTLLLQCQAVHESRIRVIGPERDGPLESHQGAVQVSGFLKRHTEISKRSIKCRVELRRFSELSTRRARFALSLQRKAHGVECRRKPRLKVDGRLEFSNRRIDLLFLKESDPPVKMPLGSTRSNLPILRPGKTRLYWDAQLYQAPKYHKGK